MGVKTIGTLTFNFKFYGGFENVNFCTIFHILFGLLRSLIVLVFMYDKYISPP